jgi:hypothetical protein
VIRRERDLVVMNDGGDGLGMVRAVFLMSMMMFEGPS